jgi:AcrR family transcriptional regulator
MALSEPAGSDGPPALLLDISYDRFIRSFDMTDPPPSSHDPATLGDGGATVTRQRLLDAAEELFARKGYAATSVRDITAVAECNLAAVNYHFHSKRNLYREVFRRRLGVMREQRLAAVETATLSAGRTGDLAATLLAFSQAFLAPLREDPKGRGPLRLMMREIVDPLLPPDFFHTELIVPVNRALNAAISEAAPELSEREVRLCVQSFLGQLLHVMHAQRVAATSVEEPGDPFTPAELVEHVARFTVAGIERLREEER